MKKAIKWITIFFLAALISHHPTQMFLAFIVLLVITGVAALLKLVISWVKSDAKRN